LVFVNGFWFIIMLLECLRKKISIF
jgi:hypothetical protein